MTAERPIHVAILGAGAVGLTLAAFLRTRGHRVTLLTRDGTAALPVRLHDEIGGRELVLKPEDVELGRASDPPRVPDHLIVCTRAEQLEAALSGLRTLDSRVPITNAAATLEDVPALARRLGVANPMLVMGVGFAAWPIAERRYRVFALSPPGPAVAPLTAARGSIARDLAQLLAAAGFPAQAPPPKLFRWVFQTLLSLEVAWMQSYRRAGWELDTLAARPELLRLCGAAMAEAARAVPAGGPVAAIARRVPASLFTRFATRRARDANQGFRDVWRHHGPKCEEQLSLLTRQLLHHANGRPMPALRDLAHDQLPSEQLETTPGAHV
jgi:ketopantoate reductase